MTASINLILNKEQIRNKTRRIAFEVVENNHDEDMLVIVGIAGPGYTFAERLVQELKRIVSFDPILVKLTLDKKAPLQSDILIDCETSIFENQSVILVDDVLHTGPYSGLQP